ncbi:protein of unknown function (DUF4211) [Mactra antiquata]
MSSDLKKKKGADKRKGENEKKRNELLKNSFIVGKTKIPWKWKHAYVLMNTGDIPSYVGPGDVVNVSGQDAKKIKLEFPDDDSDINDINSEDEMIDSDDDTPPSSPATDNEINDGDKRKTRKSTAAFTANDADDEYFDIIDDDDEDEDIDDSDEDPGWTPAHDSDKESDFLSKKKNLKLPKSSSKTTSKKKEKVQPKKSSSSSSTSSSKTSTSSAKPSTSSAKTSTASESSQSEKEKNSSPAVGKYVKNCKIIKNDKPTGPEPSPGDFVLEKSACKNGDVPYLWQYRKGGLIQKYERQIEDGNEVYVNVQSFSDWWGCYAHLYQKVRVKNVYKCRNVEKVKLVEIPDVTVNIENVSESSPQKRPAASSNNKEKQNTQDQEITSTTNEIEEFMTGKFVLDIKDKSNVDNFPIWKIESHILLKKYEAVIKNGKIYHKPVTVYRGYKDNHIDKNYLPVKVTTVTQLPGDLVEVDEEYKPKVEINSSLEEEYEKNPLLRHFYVYMQIFLSQALEPGFLSAVTDDQTYMTPLSEIDKIVEQKKVNIERKVKWTSEFKEGLNKCPYLREVQKEVSNKTCEATIDSKEHVEESLFLFGYAYDKDTLKQTGDSHTATEYKIGKTAMKYVGMYHQLCHFKYNLYDKCLAKVKLIRESNENIAVEDIMDKCLENKFWVLQNFEHFMNIIEIS